MTDATHNGFDKPPAGWQSLVNEVQARIDAVDAAMANLRIAVRYLTANAASEHTTPSVVVDMPVAEEVPAAPATAPISEPVAAGPSAEQLEADQEAAREEVRRMVEAARSEMSPASSFAWTTMPRDVWPGSTPAPAQSEDPARDEVRRAVEEAKAQLARGELEPIAPAHDLLETTEAPIEPAVTAPVALEATAPPAAAATPAPVPYVPAPSANEVPSWTNFVEAEPFATGPGQVGFSTTESFATTPPHFDYASREPIAAVPPPTEVTQPEAIAEAPAPVDEISDEASSGPAVDEEAQREAVRLAVDRARQEMQGGSSSHADAEDEDEAAAREEVRRAVAQMRNEMNWGSSPHVSFEGSNGHSASADDPDGKREEVRRVVESARAEMNFGGGLAMYDETAPREADGLKPEETQSLFAAFAGAESSATAWHKNESEFTGIPPSIVIEDAEGRVELARVYDTLNRVDRSQAALLNYSPHSVTVGLAVREHLPEPEVMIAAVRDAFGRGCKVTTEGVKMSVKIGEGEKAA